MLEARYRGGLQPHCQRAFYLIEAVDIVYCAEEPLSMLEGREVKPYVRLWEACWPFAYDDRKRYKIMFLGNEG